MKLSLIALAAGIGLAMPAQAADVYQGGSTKDVPGAFDAPTTVNWTGFYIGGSVGYGNANHNLTVQDYFKDYCGDGNEVDQHGFDDGYSDIGNRENYLTADGVLKCAALGKGGTANQDSIVVPGQSRDVANLDGLNSHGIVGDVRLGGDVQAGRFVFGVFGSYGLNGMETEGSIGFGEHTAGFKIEKGDEWSIGARAGLLVNPRTLAYVLAAYTQTEYDFSVHGGGDSETVTVDFSGITAGAGVEFALTNNIFLGIEGTHTFYGEENIIDDYDAEDNRGTRLVDEIGETKVMGTLKIKLNSGLPSFTD